MLEAKFGSNRLLLNAPCEFLTARFTAQGGRYSMYVPNHFKEDSVETLQQHIRAYPFGLLVIADDAGIEANHVPF